MKFYNEKLKYLRKKQRFSVGDFCKLLDVGKTTLWEWETARKVPIEANIRIIARKLNVSVEKISDLKDEPKISNLKISNLNNNLFHFYDDEIKAKLKRQNDFIYSIKDTFSNLNETSFMVKVLMSTLPVIFYLKDLELNYTVANTAFLENLSLNKNYKVKGKTDSDFLPYKEAKLNTELDQRVLLQGNTFNSEMYIPGSRRKKWGIVTKKPFYDLEDKLAGVLSTFIDITDRAECKKCNAAVFGSKA
jgi:transcriptional regulator with XRE-family HTH domain